MSHNGLKKSNQISKLNLEFPYGPLFLKKICN